MRKSIAILESLYFKLEEHVYTQRLHIPQVNLTHQFSLCEERYLVVDILEHDEHGGLGRKLLRAVILHADGEVIFLYSQISFDKT